MRFGGIGWIPLVLLGVASCAAHTPHRVVTPPVAVSRVGAGVESSGGGLLQLANHAESGLVKALVKVAGVPQPLTGTAFVIARHQGAVYLLTANHVVHPDNGRQQVESIQFNGAGVDATPVTNLSAIELPLNSSADVALLRVRGTPDGTVLRLGGYEETLGGPQEGLALGYAKASEGQVERQPGSLSIVQRHGTLVITTTALVSAGMSGGPLLSRQTGLVVGVVSELLDDPATGQRERRAMPVLSIADKLKTLAGVELTQQQPPWHLRDYPASYVERPKEEQATLQALASGTEGKAAAFVILVGGAGTGKTTLALKLAWQELQQGSYSGGVWFIEVKDKPASLVLQELGAAVTGGKLPPLKDDELMALVQSHLRTHRVLVVLDDLRAERIDPLLLEALKHTPVLATSRRRYNDAHLQFVPIGRLLREQARQVLMKEVSPAQLPEVEADKVCLRLGDLAQAIHLAAGVIRQLELTADQYLARLDQNLCKTLTSDDDTAALCPSMNLSWQALDPKGRAALVTLAQAGDAPLSPGLASSLVGGATAMASIDTLVRLSLIERDNGLLNFHPIVRQWAREQWGAQLPQVVQSARQHLTEWVLAQVERTDLAAWQRQPELLAHILQAQRQTKDSETSEKIVEGWDDKLDLYGQWLALIEMWERVKEQTQADSAKRKGHAVALHQVGIYQQKRGEYTKARQYYQDSLAIDRELGDRSRIGISLHQLGMLAQYQGDYSQAKQYYQDSLAIDRERGHRSGIAISLHQLGVLSHLQGDYSQAKQYYEDSVAISRELGDRSGISKSLHQLGTLAQDQGDYAQAKQYYEDSLATLREFGDRGGISKSLHQLGNVTYLQGDYTQAKQYYEDSLAILRELGDRSGIAISLHQLGMLEQDQDDYAQAKQYYEDSLAILRELGDRSGIAKSLHQLGVLSQLQGGYAQAKQYCEDSLAIKRELGDRIGIAISLAQLGNLAEKGHDLAAAEQLTKQALEAISSTSPNSAENARVLWQMARIRKAEHQIQMARQLAQQSLQILTRLGDPAAPSVGNFLQELEVPAPHPKKK